MCKTKVDVIRVGPYRFRGKLCLDNAPNIPYRPGALCTNFTHSSIRVWGWWFFTVRDGDDARATNLTPGMLELRNLEMFLMGR